MTEPLEVTPRKDHILDHEVDGIREYDNPLPRWWVYLFYATIGFAFLYWVNVFPGIGSGDGRIANYERDVQAAKERREAEAMKAGPVKAADLLALTHDPAALARGRERFRQTCAPCHRDDGGGNIGPNLTDDFWIHGGNPEQIYATVSQGVPAKGMPTWSLIFPPDEVKAAAAYVITLRGTNPPNPKTAQGEKWKPDTTTVATADSTTRAGGGPPAAAK